METKQYSVWMAAVTSGVMAGVVAFCALVFFRVPDLEAVFLGALTGAAFGVLFSIVFKEVME